MCFGPGSGLKLILERTSTIGNSDDVSVADPLPTTELDLSTTALPVCALPYKFSGKERDAQTGESGLDNFLARSYSSILVGKFMQPDPAGLGSANLWNPQSFYQYGYVMNNPLVNSDPTGRECVWDDGRLTTSDNPATGSFNLCQGKGGTWIEHDYFTQNGLADWSPQSDANLRI